MSTNVPPLNGDGNGVFRIVIHGNSGTGKTTLSDGLGQLLNLPVIHLDEIHWRPNWTEAPDDEMVEELRTIIERGKASNTGWIVDGNYESCTKRIMDFEATDLIWLDPPFYKYFPRVLLRTFRRLFGIQEPCSPGCEETWAECFFSSKSILWWVITNHRKARNRYLPRFEEDNVLNGGKWRRLGDIDEQQEWLGSVKRHTKTL